MTPPATTLRFFIDQNVADSVGRALRAAGYEATNLREVLATNAPDQIVAIASVQAGAVLVSHDRDFKKMKASAGLTQKRFKALSRICLRCPEPEAAGRVSVALSLIVHEWQQMQNEGAERLWIEIGSSYIRCNR